jgi:DNA-binding response OmpR family regulator
MSEINVLTARPSETIAAQQALIRDQAHIIDVLKGALAANGLDMGDVLTPARGMTPQQSAILGVLYAAYPRVVSVFGLLESMPSRSLAEDDRMPKLVQVQVCHIRKRLGHAAIESFYGAGYRMGDDLYAQMSAEREAHVREPLKLAA